MSSINLTIVCSVFLVSAAASEVYSDRSLSTDMGFGLYVTVFTARSYSRNFSYARQRPDIALAGDISIAIGSVAALGAVFALPQSLSLHAALYGLSASYFLAMAIEFMLLRVGTRLALRWRSLRRYQIIWRQVRWSLLGSTTSIALQQSHSFLVSSIAGTAALAPIAAGQVPFAPMRIVTTVLINVIVPEVVVAIAHNDRGLVLRILRLSTLPLGLGVVALGVVIAVFWDLIFAYLYLAKYGHSPMQLICAAWFLIVLVTSVSAGYCAVLNAMLEFRVLAVGTVFGSIISLAGVFCLILLLGPAWSLIGVLAGEIFVLIYALIHVQRKMREWRRPSL